MTIFKKTLFPFALCAAILLCAGCKKETVAQGVAGTVTFLNYFGWSSTYNAPYGTSTIYFLTLDSALCTAENVFTSDWATIAKLDAKGRYSVALDTGDYSVIVCAAKDKNCDPILRYTWPPTVHVDPGRVTRYDIIMDLGQELR